MTPDDLGARLAAIGCTPECAIEHLRHMFIEDTDTTFWHNGTAMLRAGKTTRVPSPWVGRVTECG
jgi:hypothetical protein